MPIISSLTIQVKIDIGSGNIQIAGRDKLRTKSRGNWNVKLHSNIKITISIEIEAYRVPFTKVRGNIGIEWET